MSLGVFNISFLQMRKHRVQKGNLPKLTQFNRIPKQDLNSGSLNPTGFEFRQSKPHSLCS